MGPNIGWSEIIVILVLALIVFGPKRLPEIGRSIGRSLREFRRASDEIRGEIERDLDDEPSSALPAHPSTATPPEATTHGEAPTTAAAPPVGADSDPETARLPRSELSG